MLEHALEQHAELGHRRGRVGRALDRPPGLEPLLARAEGADPGLVPSEVTRTAFASNSAGICAWYVTSWRKAEWIVACSSAGFLSSMTATGRPLRNSTTSGPALVAALDDRELVDREPVVGLGALEVDDARLRPGDRAVGPAVLHRHAVDEHPVERPVALEERRHRPPGSACGTRRRRASAGSAGVEARERRPQPPLEDDVAVPGIRPLRGRPSRRRSPGRGGRPSRAAPRHGERGLLDDRLGERAAHAVPLAPIDGFQGDPDRLDRPRCAGARPRPRRGPTQEAAYDARPVVPAGRRTARGRAGGRRRRGGRRSRGLRRSRCRPRPVRRGRLSSV